MRAKSFGRRLGLRSIAVAIAIGATALVSQPVVHTQSGDALPFAKGFLVTGDYAVGGVDLVPGSGGGGFLTGTIPMSGVPATADVLAAYLYWETISTDISQVDHPKFRGAPITVAKASTLPLVPSTAPCWSGGSSNATYTMTMFRADVLRLLPMEKDATGKPTGRVLVNDADLLTHGEALNTVTLPDAGTGNNTPSSAGATLFIVYRDAGKPLTSISIYDGVAVQAPGTTTNQTIRGFLQAAPGATARMTQIVGSGAKNTSERLYFNNSIIATNPFLGNSSSSSDRAWSTVTFDVTSLMGAKTDSAAYGEQVTTKIDHTSATPYECLSWAAIIFSTQVKDVDRDGLPDRLEDASGLHAPDGTPLPDLHAMGASSQHKDLFIEMGAMEGDPGTTYGTQTDTVGHNHLPTPAVLKLVGDAYRNAPVANADGQNGIRAHFDVGPNYHLLGTSYASIDADQYIVPSYLARGGEEIKEVDCAATVANCDFPGYPGTVSWKIGYQLYRDQPVGANGEELSAAAMDTCQEAGNCARFRFDQDRLNFFHYVLYAHTRGKPKEPCLTGTDAEQATCRATNPLFHVPSTASGVSDLPGGDSMVTLGFWGHGFVGSDFVQATTTMHELGHSLWRSHGGNPFPISEPNCKPNYLSVMNYLFQMGGLRDEDGTPHVDYSRSVDGVLDEHTLLNDPANPVFLQYRTAWYAPLLPGTLPAFLGTPAATKFCNGGTFPALQAGDPPPVPMARVDYYSATLGTIDWSAGLNAGPPQDVNFDGQLSSLAGADDWSNLRLDQIGSRRNMGGFSLGVDFTYGLDFTGGGDFEFGLDFTGGFDFEFGLDFTGGIDFKGGIDYEFGIDFVGGVDAPFGLDFTGGVEMDREVLSALGNTPSNSVKAQVINTPGGGGLAPTLPFHRVQVVWKEPDVGTVGSYLVYRVAGSIVTPTSTKVLVGGAAVPGSDTSVVDQDELPNGLPFTYYVVAQFTDGTSSGGSNFTTIFAVNDAPVGVAESAFSTNAGQPLSAGGLLSNDTDDDSPATSLKAVLGTGPSHAAAFSFNANGSFTYTPAAGFAGTDTFTYKVNDGTWPGPPSAPMSPDSNAVTVTIMVVDHTPPVVTLTIPAPNGLAGYFVTTPVVATVTASDVSFVASIACTDGGSAVGLTPVGLGTALAQASLSLSANGTHSLVCTAVDGVGNAGAAAGSVNTGTVKIDTVAPTIQVTTPASGGVYILNSSLVANYACADPAPGSGLSSCVGNVTTGSSVNTSTVGPKTFTVTAKDVAGNQTVTTVNYIVVYAFTLTALKGPANLGSAVQVNWTLKDALGVSINSLSTLLKMESVFNGPAPAGGCVASATGTRQLLYNPATGATGGSNLRLVSGGYQFNWDTSTATTTGKGCYTILMTLDDGSAPKLTNAIQLK